VALPAYAASPDAVQRGEQLFFEHSFGPTASSIPMAVFQALQRQDQRFAPEALTERYGLLYKSGRELPIGFVGAPALGVERLSFNCSLCHTGRAAGRVVAGMPNTGLRMQEFEEDLMDALKRGVDVTGANPYETAQIKLWLMLARRQAEAFKPSPHRAGPGRFDLLQTFKKRLGLPPHTFNAQMDIPALYGARMLKRYPRDGALGGNQDLVRYLIVRLSGDNSPLKDGKVPGWVTDLNAYLASLEPPANPYPVDRARAAEGHQLFRNTCAPCHGVYEPYELSHPNRIIPQAVVGTDPQRVQVWDAASIAYVKRDAIMRQLDLQPGVGMLPPSLRGVWATPPYLHNGSVPTLYDVLSDPKSRPATFRRGTAYDPVRVGLDRDAVDGFLYDTRIPGNGNMGHPFGVPLSERERMAVIEYLKTL
jgi:hypothetical protein